MTLQDIISQHIFESYEVINRTDLQKEIKNVAILDTTDFSNFSDSHSLILTTLAAVEQDLPAFSNLIIRSKELSIAGIVIRASEQKTPTTVFLTSLVISTDIPLILLHYDVSLSNLFSAIYSELQTESYLQHNFHANFTRCMEMIQKNPSSEVLIETIKDIPNFDVMFYDLQTKEIHSSNAELLAYAEDNTLPDGKIQYLRSYIFYKEDIKFNDVPIYRMLIRSSNENRHIIHTYAEIFRIMIGQIHQRKTDLAMHLDQFLMNFVMNFTSSYSSNQDIINEGKIYNWHIEFPLVMLLVTSKSNKKDLPNNGNLVNQLKADIIQEYNIRFEEVKYISFQNKITFLFNSKYSEQICTEKMRNIIRSDKVYDNFLFAITKPLEDAAKLPSYYRQIMDASQYVYENNPATSLIPPDFIDFYHIINSMDKNSLHVLVMNLIGPLVEFERTHSVPLTKTLLVFIQCHFNIKQASTALYVHYNTLKYRLSIIRSLGYDINDYDYNFLPLFMALYLYDIGLVQIQ